MTVEEAVLDVLIEHWPYVRNDVVQFAHPVHKLSGCSRLRGLKNKGLVDYRFEKDAANTYTIYTSKERLIELRDEIRAGKRFGEMGRPQVPHSAGRCWGHVKHEEAMVAGPVEEIDIEEIRRFKESLP